MSVKLRHEIKTALQGLGDNGSSLLKSCKSFLFVLGYTSNRTLDIGGVEGFKKEAISSQNVNKRDLELLKYWNDVQFLFQFTSEEVQLKFQSGFESKNIHSFLFLAVDLLPDCVDSRRYLADTTRMVNKVYSIPSIIVFRHREKITVSVIHRREHKRDASKDVLERVTLIKDIDTRNPHRSHIDILAELSLQNMLEEGVEDFEQLHDRWERSLNISELNHQFYRELLQWYETASEVCIFPEDKSGQKSNQRHVIRLITRLLFVWFLKEMELVPDDIFQETWVKKTLKHYTREATDYYRAVLQNLFFATLNTEMAKRLNNGQYRYLNLIQNEHDLRDKFMEIPFVNGGLFDCLDEFDETGGVKIVVDAFLDSDDWVDILEVPAELFFGERDGLLSIFKRYKFTLEESTPLDCEVALDPELLGCVFENLLDIYNPLSGNQERKETGAYYTPRPIVNYMVRTALIERLTSNLTSTKENDLIWRLDYLFNHNKDCDDASIFFNEEEINVLTRSIAELKILDPAVGSGAFLMGALQVLTLALNRLDPENQIWKQIQREVATLQVDYEFDVQDESIRREKAIKAVNAAFETYKKPDFGRKLYLFHHGLYGIDIQPIACQIAKLRFFISLVIEQKIDRNLPNFGITPLPNLETNLIAADSLHRIKHRPEEFEIYEWESIQEEIQKTRQQFFLANDPKQKREIKERDNKLRQNLLSELEGQWQEYEESEKSRIARVLETIPSQNSRDECSRIENQKLKQEEIQWREKYESARKIAIWEPYNPNSIAHWFEEEYMFGLLEGFDIVIGNPPYISLQKEEGKLANKYKNEQYSSFERKGDVYQLFFERGLQCLKKNTGTLAFITSNSYLKTQSGNSLRKYFYDNHMPIQLVMMGEKCFQSATVDTAILIVREGRHTNKRRCHALKIENQGSVKNTLKLQPAGFVFTEDSRSWHPLTDIEKSIVQKIETVGTPLRDWDLSIHMGIKTGFNKAFIVNSTVRDQLIREDPNSDELLKPILRGEDIQRYHATWAGNWF